MPGRWVWLGGALLAASACTELEPQVSFAYDGSLAKRLAARDGAWAAACERAARGRIGLPPALHQESTHRPVAPDFVADLARAVKGLPPPFAALFERHVCAVVLMHGAPMTATLTPLSRDSKRSLLLLNVEKMNLPPNEWLAFKESSAFERARGLSIRGKMAEANENTRAVLMEFVLVHELGHVVDHAFPDHLLIEEFKSVSWPRTDALAGTPFIHYPERIPAPPLPERTLEAYYDLIAEGPFASPATVSNSGEDFADSIATFMHTVIRGRPWEIEAEREGRLVRKLNACWSEPRCRAKRNILEVLVERWTTQ